MSLGADQLFEALVSRFDGMRLRPLSVEGAHSFWSTLCALLCHQLTNGAPGKFGGASSVAAGTPSRQQRARPSSSCGGLSGTLPPRPSDLRTTPVAGSRVVVPGLASFVRLETESSVALPHVVFVPNDGFCEAYSCHSRNQKWRVSGAIRTHELNIRELARRLDRPVDESARLLQGAIAIVGEWCEAGQPSVSLAFPGVGELKCERRNLSFAFRLEPDASFTFGAPLLSSLARIRPSTAAADERTAAFVAEQQRQLEHQPEASAAAEQRGDLAAAITTAIQQTISQREAIETHRYTAERPASSCASSIAGHSRPQSAGPFAAEFHSELPPRGASQLSSLSNGGRFAAAKARRYQVAAELQQLQEQALQRLAVHGGGGSSDYGGSAIDASSVPRSTLSRSTSPGAARAVSALSGTLNQLAAGSFVGRSASASFRQPPAVAVELAIETAVSRQREALLRARAEDEKLAAEAERRRCIGELAEQKHAARSLAFNKAIQQELLRQMDEKASRRAATPTISIARQRDLTPFERETLTERWVVPEDAAQRKTAKQQTYKAALDNQRSYRSSIDQTASQMEAAEDRELVQLSTIAAVEKFQMEQERRRAERAASRLAWDSQIKLKQGRDIL